MIAWSAHIERSTHRIAEELITMKEFEYCLNSSTIKPAGLRQKIEIASEAGYDGIELWHDDIDQYLREGGAIADVRKWLQDRGLSVPTTIYLKDWFCIISLCSN